MWGNSGISVLGLRHSPCIRETRSSVASVCAYVAPQPSSAWRLQFKMVEVFNCNGGKIWKIVHSMRISQPVLNNC